MALSKKHKAFIAKSIAGPPTSDAGPRCGNCLFLIAKVQAGLPLSIVERDFILDVIRESLFSPKDWKDYQHWRELRFYDQLRKIAPYAAPPGEREDWTRRVLKKGEAALRRWVSRARRG